jgi:hypothetical protein
VLDDIAQRLFLLGQHSTDLGSMIPVVVSHLSAYLGKTAMVPSSLLEVGRPPVFAV